MPRLPLVFAAALVALTATGTTPSAAQSFNCNFARAPDEVAICQDDGLGALDERMSTLYFRVRASLGGAARADLEAEQAAWLRARRTCGRNFGCIERSYRQRIRELQAW